MLSNEESPKRSKNMQTLIQWVSSLLPIPARLEAYSLLWPDFLVSAY